MQRSHNSALKTVTVTTYTSAHIHHSVQQKDLLNEEEEKQREKWPEFNSGLKKQWLLALKSDCLKITQLPSLFSADSHP